MRLFRTKSGGDIEKLSAYLDGELSRREAAHLENRLEVEPTLQQQLAKIRNIRTLFREQPQAPLLRNFTLGPEHDGVSSVKDRGRSVLSHTWALNGKVFVAAVRMIVFVSSYLFATGSGDLMSRTAMFAQADQPDCYNEDDPIIYWTENANYVRNMPVGCKLENKIRSNRLPVGTDLDKIENVVKGIGGGNNLRQIAADDEYLYWADMKNHRIMKASRDQPNNECSSSSSKCFAIVEGKARQ